MRKRQYRRADGDDPEDGGEWGEDLEVDQDDGCEWIVFPIDAELGWQE